MCCLAQCWDSLMSLKNHLSRPLVLVDVRWGMSLAISVDPTELFVQREPQVWSQEAKTRRCAVGLSQVRDS
jgi:hypothetical protein